MKAIGGYFSLENLLSKEYHSDLLSLNSGRNALLYVLKARKIKKLYIPYYLCDSISDTLKRNDIKFERYRIDKNFIPLFDSVLHDNEYIYIVNYFGQLDNNTINKLKIKYGNIIIDNAQAFYNKPINGIDTIYTCRKFFGVPDGAYVSTDANINEKLEVDISKDRMSHILGRYEGEATDYYDKFQKNEEIFSYEPIKYMSKLTKNILGAIDYDNACRRRNENYDYLKSKLSKYNQLKLKKSIGPFAYPFYVKDKGVEIRKELAKIKIYVPTLWPNVLNEVSLDSIEYEYAKNILPLPCDQRYTAEDMEIMVKYLLSII